jgi:hypothetical protein
MFRPRRPLLPHGHPERSEGSAFLFSPIRALSVPALSSSFFPAVACELSTACPERSRRGNCPLLIPFPATLTDPPQLAENPATLSPVPATLTSRVKHNPFVCHSYKKHPGVGVSPDRHPVLHLNRWSSPNSHRVILLLTLLHCRKSYLQSFQAFPHSFRKTPGVGCPLATASLVVPQPSAPIRLVSLPPYFITSLLRLASVPLKPLPHMAHPYLCTCKKGPAAREPRYSPCAAS